MELIQIVDKLNSLEILFDNENLSVPFFKITDNDVVMSFFTYSLEFTNPIVVTVPERIIKIMDKGHIQVDDFAIEIFNNNNPYFYGCNCPKGAGSYELLLVTIEKMIESEFSVETVKLFQEMFNKCVSHQLAQIYLNVGIDYFEYLSEIIKFE